LYEPIIDNDDSFVYDDDGDDDDHQTFEPIVKQQPDDVGFEEDPDFGDDLKFSNRKRRKRSLTWNYFDRASDCSASCKFCLAEIRTEGGTTSGMLTHLRRIHPDIYLADFVPNENHAKAEKKYERVSMLLTSFFPSLTVLLKRHDTQHNDTRHNISVIATLEHNDSK